MNEISYRIMGLHKKIERNKNLAQRLKIVAAACLFFSVCYCHGTKVQEYVDKSEMIMTNVVWLIFMILLVGMFLKDSSLVKRNKATEFEIYHLELEDLDNKKVVAQITGRVLPDHIENKQVNEPDAEVKLPYIYYGALLVVNIIARLSLIGTIVV